MLARTHTFTVEGLEAHHVTVEVDVRNGLPAFAIIGLADTALREARERVRTAILNSGLRFPPRRITANLAPADLPKAGPGLDLALACGVLAASGQLPRERLDSHAFVGELALDGGVRPVRGALAAARCARRCGLEAIVLAPVSAREAALVDGLAVAAAGSLHAAARVLRGGRADALPTSAPAPTPTPPAELADVRGQHHAVRALVLAAAGAHNLLLSGAPGTGKTMLAQRLPALLPAMSREEALETTALATSTQREQVGTLATERPFRAPHHTVSAAGLVGGADAERPGEVVLAHNGVLFLDELPEFARGALEALRQPLEDGRVAISRARHRVTYPARFLLVAAGNPCPCGRAGEPERCACAETQLARHARRLSGPLLDRIDLLATLERAGARPGTTALTSTAAARARVLEARERQRRRLAAEDVSVNGRMDSRLVQRHAAPDAAGEELLRKAAERGLLSARGALRALRVARTLADLAGRERVAAEDIGSALALRPEALLRGAG